MWTLPRSYEAVLVRCRVTTVPPCTSTFSQDTAARLNCRMWLGQVGKAAYSIMLLAHCVGDRFNDLFPRLLRLQMARQLHGVMQYSTHDDQLSI